jgi:DNA-binding MarR family transcriptional regulator
MQRTDSIPSGTSEGSDSDAARTAPDPTVRVLRNFRSVFGSIKLHFQHVERKTGVGGAQVWALSIIRAQPGVGVNELASAMDVHQSTASNLVKSLLQQQLIRTEKNARDKRMVQLYVLPAGRAILRKSPAPLSGVLHAALAQLDDRTLSRLDKDLTALLRVMHTDPRSAQTPLADL